MRLEDWAALLGGRELSQAVGKETQGALRRDLGIELAHGPGRRIARVHEGFFALCSRGDLLPLPLVHRFKFVSAHINLAAHFQHRRRIGRQSQGNLPHRADVVGHILTRFAVAPRGRLHEDAVFIAQTHRQTVKLQLRHIFHRRRILGQLQFFANPRIKCLRAAGFGVRFCANRQHRDRMANRCQPLHHRAEHALRGRIGGDQLGMIGLQSLQELEHTVVFRIREGWLIEHVILVRVVVQKSMQGIALGNRRGLRILGNCY